MHVTVSQGQPPQPGYPVNGGYPPQQPQYPVPHPFGVQPAQPAQLGSYPQPAQTFQQTSTVIMQPGLQTTQANIVPLAPRPSSYIGLSIFNFLSCNSVLGIVAIIFSCMVDSAYNRGDYEEARRNSNIAKWLNIVSIVLGFILVVVVTVWRIAA